MITDALFTSPILHGDDAGGVGGMPADGSGGMVNDVAAGGLPGAGGQFAQYGGVNPELDPELANVLKESLEAERDRVRQAEAAEGAAKAESAQAVASSGNPPTSINAQPEEEEYDEAAMIAEAIKLSMADEEKPEEKADEKPAQQQAAADAGTNLDNIVTTEFMKGLVDDLDLDIDPNQIDNVMKEAGIGNEEEKKEEEKKEEEKKEEKPGDSK